MYISKAKIGPKQKPLAHFALLFLCKQHWDFIPSHYNHTSCCLITHYVHSPQPLNSLRILSLASYSFIIQFWFIQCRMYHKYMSATEWMTNFTAKWNVGLYRQTTHRCKCAWAVINYVSMQCVYRVWTELIWVRPALQHWSQRRKWPFMSTRGQNVSCRGLLYWTDAHRVSLVTLLQ